MDKDLIIVWIAGIVAVLCLIGLFALQIIDRTTTMDGNERVQKCVEERGGWCEIGPSIYQIECFKDGLRVKAEC